MAGEPQPLKDDKYARSLLRRRQLRKYRWVLWLLLMVPVVYFVVQVFILLAPRMRYDVALLDSMTDSVRVTGQAALNSTPITGAQGYLYYTVPSGQRVAADAEVALVFASEQGVQAMDRLAAVEAELELLREAQITTVEGSELDGLLDGLHGGLYDVLAHLDSGNYGELEAPRNELSFAANKIQIATGQISNFEARIIELTAQKEQLEGSISPLASVLSPDTGYFVPASLHDKKSLSGEVLAEMTPKQLQQALNSTPSYHSGNVAGHLVLDYRWEFYTVVPSKEAEKFVVGDKDLQLSFPEHGDLSVPVTVQQVTVDEQNEIATIVLHCEYLSPEVMTLRTENAEIIFGTQKGIRIDKSALRLVDEKNEDGTVNTYRGVYVEFGNMVYFRKVQVLLEDEFYILVPDTVTDGVNEVKLYDKIVVDSGGVELYDRKIL